MQGDTTMSINYTYIMVFKMVIPFNGNLLGWLHLVRERWFMSFTNVYTGAHRSQLLKQKGADRKSETASM